MAQINNQTRLSALQKAPRHIQEMHGSLETAELLTHLQSEYKIQDDTFIDIVGDIMLGLYPKSDLRKLLRAFLGISDEVGASIERDLSTLLFKIDGVPVIPPAPRDMREKLDLRPEGVVPTPSANTMPGNERPLTREEVLRSITPKRTMASDIESVRQEKEGGHSPFGDSR